MVLTITSALSLFLLIGLSTVVYFASKRMNVPYTVLLVLAGLLLVPLSNMPLFNSSIGFIKEMALTPEMLFYFFLPVLIFEAGFNMKIRQMVDSAWAISLLAIVSVVLSASLVAGALYIVMPLIGINIPFIVALIFGSIISATDPVAVLAIFKEQGAPKRLTMIFEGESLMNDGTAVALFLVVLGVAVDGYHGVETVTHGVMEFVIMIVMGVVVGLALAALFSKALRYTKKNEFVTVTLLLISAHMVFIMTEMINHYGLFHVSPIISTTVAALFLGNYSRNILPPTMDGYLNKLLEHMAFVINSLVFLMAGLLFASAGVDFGELWLPIIITVLIVATARIISVYAVTTPINFFKMEQKIPSSWEKLLAWGSLRGAISIIAVLLIPKDLSIPGWDYQHTPYELLLALTTGCILATLFIKAPMIGPLMRKYKVTDPTPLKLAHESDLSVFYLLAERERLSEYRIKGFLSEERYTLLFERVERSLATAEDERKELVEKYGRTVFDQSLHLTMVHAETNALKKLYINEEISEKPYRRILNKLSLQKEMIEQAQHNDIDPKKYMDRKDVFEHLTAYLRAPLDKNRYELSVEQRLEYYRAQMIMARKALKIVESMQSQYGHPVFLEESYAEVLARYRSYRERSAIKADDWIAANEERLQPHLAWLADRSLVASGVKALTYLHDNGLIDEHTEHDVLAHCAS
jgi:monovalent cation:H+ antiporter, CPA1 family